MFDKLRAKIAALISPPDAKLIALPVTLNASKQVAAKRMAGRLMNLYAIKAPDAEALQSIENYKLGLDKLGYTPPNNADEAELLVAKLRLEH